MDPIRVAVMGFDDDDKPTPYHAQLIQIEGDQALIAWNDSRVTPLGAFERVPLNRLRWDSVALWTEADPSPC